MADSLTHHNPGQPPDRTIASQDAKNPNADDVSTKNRIGKYLVSRRIGSGGMGVVYEAVDTLLDRRVALKMLVPVKSASGSGSASADRLILEAKAAAKLNHPNVVTVHEIGEEQGAVYIAMELVTGGSVQSKLDKTGPLPWQQAIRVIVEVCQGLQEAHAAGLIHRDIKPGNILLTETGTAKLADFGLVKVVDQGTTSLSRNSVVLGTPYFMSPEQCRSEPLDARSDLYSLGVVLFTLVTGKPPFVGDQPVQVLFAHCSTPVPNLRSIQTDLPEGLIDVIEKALAKEPAKRFSSASEMATVLQQMINETTDKVAPVVTAVPVAVPQKKTNSRRAFLWHALALLGVAGILGALALLPRLKETRKPTPENKTVQPGAWLQKAAKNGLILRYGADRYTTTFSPDGRWLVYGPTEKDLAYKLINLHTGAEKTLPTFPHVGPIDFSPDGQYMAIGLMGGSGLRLYRLSDGRVRDVPDINNCSVMDLQFSRDSRILYLSVEPWNKNQPFLRIVDMATVRQTGTLPGHAREVGMLALSPNGRQLASASVDNVVNLYNVKTRRLENEIQMESAGERFARIAYHPSGRNLTLGLRKRIRFLQPQTLQDASDSWPMFGSISCMAYSPDGSLLATSVGVSVYLWDTRTGDRLTTFTGHEAVVFVLSFSADGSVLVTGSHDGTARFRDVSPYLGSEPAWQVPKTPKKKS